MSNRCRRNQSVFGFDCDDETSPITGADGRRALDWRSRIAKIDEHAVKISPNEIRKNFDIFARTNRGGGFSVGGLSGGGKGKIVLFKTRSVSPSSNLNESRRNSIRFMIWRV
jgi:hypothetical protein